MQSLTLDPDQRSLAQSDERGGEKEDEERESEMKKRWPVSQPQDEEETNRRGVNESLSSASSYLIDNRWRKREEEEEDEKKKDGWREKFRKKIIVSRTMACTCMSTRSSRALPLKCFRVLKRIIQSQFYSQLILSLFSHLSHQFLTCSSKASLSHSKWNLHTWCSSV